MLFCLDNEALKGGGISDSCSNNVSDTIIQMSPATSAPGQFGQIGFNNPIKAVLNINVFNKDDQTGNTSYLCEKINEYTCNAGSFLFDGSCYTFVKNLVTHAQADYNCHLIRGQILKITNRKQQTFINAAFPASVFGYNKIWLDYRKLTYNMSDLKFSAIDDTTLVFDSSGIDFTSSTPIAPNLTDPSINCVAMDTTQGSLNGWNTLSCLENASYICQQDQIMSPALIRIIPVKQLLLPLDLNSGFKDLTILSRANLGSLVAITTDQFLPSGLVGAAHFLGSTNSFIRIDNAGPAKAIRYQFGISVSMWIYIDLIYDGETQYLIDARPECITGSEVDEGFTLSLVNGPAASIVSLPINPICSFVSNPSVPATNTTLNQHVVLVAKLCSYNSTTKCDKFVSPDAYPIPVQQWTYIGFTYNAISKHGTFFVNEHYGYYDKISGFGAHNRYFTYDSANWLINSSSVAVNAPIQIGSNKYLQSGAYSGKMSCLQWYEGPLTQSQFIYLKQCPLNNTYPSKATLCPQGFEYYKKNCYKFSSKAQDFASAEAYCTSTPGNTK